MLVGLGYFLWGFGAIGHYYLSAVGVRHLQSVVSGSSISGQP